MDPKIAQQGPYILEMKPGVYYWCRCGFSKNQPFCDGSHITSGTGLKPIETRIDETKTVAWCGCKRTIKPPFCDGSHNRMIDGGGI